MINFCFIRTFFKFDLTFLKYGFKSKLKAEEKFFHFRRIARLTSGLVRFISQQTL